MASRKLLGNVKVRKFLAEHYLKYQSFLLTGIEGIGKFSIANAFAKWLLPNGNLDLIVLGRDAPVKVSEIRKAESFLSKTSANNGRKVLIVDDLDHANKFVLGCLLKTLEDPPEKSTIVLISNSTHNLPSTIVSRCIVLNCTAFSWEELHKITGIADKTLLMLAGGSVSRLLLLARNDACNIYKTLLKSLHEGKSMFGHCKLNDTFLYLYETLLDRYVRAILKQDKFQECFVGEKNKLLALKIKDPHKVLTYVTDMLRNMSIKNISQPQLLGLILNRTTTYTLDWI